MKKDKNISNQALGRVKHLFSKERPHQGGLTHNPSRAYDYLKLPRLLMGKQRMVSSSKGKHDLSKKQVSCTGNAQCSLNPKYLMYFLFGLKSLQKHRSVKKLYLKEHLLAKRNFQNMGREMNELMNSYFSHTIEPIDKEKNKEEEPFPDYHTQKEERQFLITRVIRYLLD